MNTNENRLPHTASVSVRNTRVATKILYNYLARYGIEKITSPVYNNVTCDMMAAHDLEKG